MIGTSNEIDEVKSELERKKIEASKSVTGFKSSILVTLVMQRKERNIGGRIRNLDGNHSNPVQLTRHTCKTTKSDDKFCAM